MALVQVLPGTWGAVPYTLEVAMLILNTVKGGIPGTSS